MWNLRNKTNKQSRGKDRNKTKFKKKKLNYREQTDGYQRRGGGVEWVKEVKGIKVHLS